MVTAAARDQSVAAAGLRLTDCRTGGSSGQQNQHGNRTLFLLQKCQLRDSARQEAWRYICRAHARFRRVAFDALVATAKKALFAMRRRCALLGIQDPALQCKLFDTLVLPILSYGCEVWGVDTKCGAAAEALHREFLRRLLGVRKSTANHMVLAELGRFPLQVHFWQQILRYHHRTCCTIALDNVRLVKLAMVDGFALHQTAVKDSWQHYLGDFLHGHLGQQQLFHSFDICALHLSQKWLSISMHLSALQMFSTAA